MSVRGIGFFDDLLGAAIRRDFEAAVNAGASVYAAADRIVAEHVDSIHDPDSAPVIFYALADLQLQHGCVSAKIRKLALTLINSGDGMERWKNEAVEIYEARKNIEQDLRARLVAFG